MPSPKSKISSIGSPELPAFAQGIDPWYWTTSEGSEMYSLLLGYHESFREKLQWLEEAENLSLVFQKNRESAKANPPSPSPADH